MLYPLVMTIIYGEEKMLLCLECKELSRIRSKCAREKLDLCDTQVKMINHIDKCARCRDNLTKIDESSFHSSF